MVSGDVSGLQRRADVLGRLGASDVRATAWAAAVGAAIVFCVGIPLAAILNIWTDEAFTLHTTAAGPLAAWSRTVAFEDQPPLYFSFIGAWRLVNEHSILFARVPSMLFAAAGVAVIVVAARRIAPAIPPLAIALVCALNPLVVWSAVEMRVYPLVFLAGAVLTWTFVEGFLIDEPPSWARVAYVVFAVIGLYTQYYVGFLLLANAITVLFIRRRSLVPMIVAGAAVTAAFAPFARVAIAQAKDSGGFVAHVSAVHAAHEVFNAVYMTLLPHLYDSSPTKFAALAVAAALALSIIAFGRAAIAPTAPVRGVTLTWLVCLAIFSVMFAVSGLPFNVLSHTIVSAPLSLLVAFAILSSLTRRMTAIAVAAACVYALFTASALWSAYRPPPSKIGDWQRVAAAIAPDEPAIPVAVFPAESAVALSWYLPDVMISIPRPMPFTNDYVAATTLHSVEDVARTLDPVRARAARLWVVSTNCTGVVAKIYDYHCNYLQAYLSTRYRLVRHLAFNGSNARLYERIGGSPDEPR